MNSSTSSFEGYFRTYFFTLVGLLFISALATEWLVRSQVEPNDALFRHLQFFHAARSRDVAFGDSHTANGFAATGGFLNLAFPGENVQAITRKLSIYVKGKPPGRVVLQADPHMFAAYQLDKDMGYMEHLEQPASKKAFGLEEIRMLNSYHRPKLLAYWVSFLKTGELHSKSATNNSGWLPSNGRWDRMTLAKRVTQARWRADLQRPMDNFEKHPAAAAYRETILALVSLGWQPCLVEYPASREWLNSAQSPNFERARAWFRAVAADAGVNYLEYRAVFRDRLDLFSNQDHLNPIGAAQFTAAVIEACFGAD